MHFSFAKRCYLVQSTSWQFRPSHRRLLRPWKPWNGGARLQIRRSPRWYLMMRSFGSSWCVRLYGAKGSICCTPGWNARSQQGSAQKHRIAPRMCDALVFGPRLPTGPGSSTHGTNDAESVKEAPMVKTLSTRCGVDEADRTEGNTGNKKKTPDPKAAS